MFFHRPRYTLFLLLGSFSLGLPAANLETVTLENGATVLLHDDYTWEYIVVNTDTAEQANKMIPSDTIDSKELSPSNSNQASKSQFSLLRSGLLNTNVKNDVKVTYDNSTWQDQTLGLTFILSSNNADGVVLVKVAVSFYDDNAHKIAEKIINVWQASYRLPETYLRKGQSRNSRVIWIEGINKAKWTNKLLSLDVLEVNTR